MKQRFFKNPLVVIFFTVFVDMLGFGILLPVIPFLLASPSSPESVLAPNMSVQDGYVLLGYLAAAYPFAQFIASPVLGQLSDTYGRKKILILSISATSISYLLFALGIVLRSIPLLFVSRIFGGMMGGNVSVAQAVIADSSTVENRTKSFGLIGAAFGLGFIVGPYFGGKLLDSQVVPWFNATTPFLFAALLCLFNVIFIIFFLAETLQHRKPTLKLAWNEPFKNIRKALAEKGKREIYITILLFQSGIAFFTTFISVYLIHRFQLREGSVGEFFAYAGLWIAFTQIIITRFMPAEKKEAKILSISLIGAGICILLLFIPVASWELLFIVPFFSIFIGLAQATSMALVSNSADQFSQGESLGVSSSLQALAQSFPPILSGYIAAAAHPSGPIFVSAAVIILAGIVFTFRYRYTTPHG